MLALAASLGIHAAALFAIDIEFPDLADPPVLFAELKPLPKTLVQPAPPPETAPIAPTSPDKPPRKKKTPRPSQALKPAHAEGIPALPAHEPPPSPAREIEDAPPEPPEALVAPTNQEPPDAAPEISAPKENPPPPETSPLPPPYLPESGEIHYRVDRGDQGFEIGRAVSRWEIHGDDYVLQLTTETSGLVWLLKSLRIDMESWGKIRADGLRPERFVIRRNQQETNENAVFDWERRQIRLGNGTVQPLDDGAQDLLSFNFHLGFMPQASVARVLPVTTGKKYGIHPLEILGDETIETPAGILKTLHLRAPGVNRTELWLAYDYLLLPVKIRYEDKKGNSLVQTVTAIRVGEAP